MSAEHSINFVELITGTGEESQTCLFEDGHFTRHRFSRTLTSGIRADVIIDSIDTWGIECFHVSMSASVDSQLEFVLADAEITSHQHGILVTDAKQGELFWFPSSAFLRQYDEYGRITGQVESPLEVIADKSGSRLAAAAKAGGKLEFGLMHFRSQIDSFKRELLEFSPVETTPVVRNTWFRYERVSDVWTYYIMGDVFNVAGLGASKGWCSQNMAYALYYHLDFLGKRTGKKLYLVLRDLIGYSVLLSLPADSRWRHGVWTDLMETHLVHQASGIHILLSHYENTANDLFMEKARSAVDYLLSCADRLDGDRIWFLHDSLETDDKQVGLYYRNLTISRAFGKSPSNTLCLNTHIWTLTVLHRMSDLTHDKRYREAFEKGLATLCWLLGQKPASCLYGLVYHFRDFLIRLVLRTNSKLIRKIQKRYDDALKKSILPRLKKKFPRFVMPNGFIERDLCFAPLSDFYHMLNLKDLLILYSQNPCDWLAGILEKSVPDTAGSGLANYAAIYGSRASVFLEVLLMYAAMIDDNYLSVLVRYFMRFKDLNQTIQTDLLANPLIVDPSLSLTCDDSQVIILAPAKSTKFVAVIINTADTDIEPALGSDSGGDLDKLEIIDSRNNRLSCEQEVAIPKGGFLKVVRKNG
ncbi:MAG: hypothetical protein J7M40_12265 [Planctomycetes bacterium]|nr:hypothetical protein [Planctomycetota bacterium]